MSTRAPILGRFRYGYVAPAALLVAGLLYVPFLWTAYLSFTKYDGLAPPEWVGLRNFGKLLDDPALLTALGNTLIWVVGTMALPVGLGLLVAVLSYDLKGGVWYRVPFMLPYALSGAGLAMVWSPILSHDGIANILLGVDTAFLQKAPHNTIAMLLVWTWQQLGVNTLLFVVGLQSIPKAPIEAARIDGASGWTLFRHVIWPLMAPLTAVVVGLALVASLKTFDIVWVLTQGGPGRNSETLAVTMYKDTFVASDYGYGASVAVMLTVVTGLASFLYLRRQVR
ncbi:carbohydrate ABC transporter permease [Nonomuraea aurantiaca]|uniref:carbohydrate ABC transporter permease n=1 Tax=Nonomuraea aurantiaca TaxID=2878562 RepID=UPI001CD9E690|nr:sugar ABC transporter permease [Nonomuraea aurantiaca]MCA2224203.1 sugar ABC transporter permease [Nonomuraea aurantiaca]